MADGEDINVQGGQEVDSIVGTDVKQCKFCSSSASKYVCPRCGVRYCSSLCYKHPSHLMCSEDFFKQCIQEELDSTAPDSRARKQMMEALQKMHEEGQEDEELDSDDEADDLASRLENIDLDNAEAVWSQLTDAERAEFESLVASGEVTKILPVWEPWWCVKQSPLIEEVDRSQQSNTPQYPALVPNIPLFYVICTVKPSPCIEFNMINLVASYVFTSRHYNGEPPHTPKEAASCLLQMSDNLRHNNNFTSQELAVQGVAHNAVNMMQASSEDTRLIQTDVKAILSSKQFVLYALSGASHILSAAKTGLKAGKKQSTTCGGDKRTKQSFSTRFPESASEAGASDFVLTKPVLNSAIKKLEFYMSWVNAYYAEPLSSS